MNYVKVINKAEILLYSSLISIMSGINRLKGPEHDLSKVTPQEVPAEPPVQADVLISGSVQSSSINWESIQQAILSLLLWTVLGLAAGFLLGMLRHG